MNNNFNNLDDRKEKLLKYVISVLTIIMLIFAIINFQRKLFILSTSEIILSGIGIILFYFISKKNHIKVIIIALLSSIYLFTIFSYSRPNIHFTTFIWAVVTTSLTFYFIKRKYAIIFTSIYLIITSSMFIYTYITTSLIPLPAALNIIIFIFSYTFFMDYYEKTRKISRAKLLKEIEIRKETEEKNKQLILELEENMSEIKQLSSFLPICSSCKNIRDDDGYWNKIEDYVSKHSDTTFSHSICPVCTKKLYPEYYDEIDESDYK